MASRALDGYIRVSRKGGREGDSFISPDIQRRKIEAWAAANDVEVLRWEEEIDASGATLNRPGFKRILARIAAGDTDGIVVADRSRFARSLIDAVRVIELLDDRGAEFAAADGFDMRTKEGRLGVHVMLSFAQFELDRQRDAFAAGIRGAVADGVHISGVTPYGYAREKPKRGRLVPDPAVAALITEVYRRRARGESTATLASYMQENGVTGITRNGVASVLRNDVYLGVARGPGGAVNKTAHEPLVTQAEWDAAQRGRGLYNAKDGTMAAHALLAGLARCAGCGRRLRVIGSTPRTGPRRASYTCHNPNCLTRAAVLCKPLDDYVEGVVQDAALAGDPRVAAIMEGDDRYLRAQRDVAAARRELENFYENAPSGNRELLQRGIKAREAKVEASRRALAQIEPPAPITERVFTSYDGADMDARRTEVRRFVAEVRLASAGGKRGKQAPPVWERATVLFVGEMAA